MGLIVNGLNPGASAVRIRSPFVVLQDAGIGV